MFEIEKPEDARPLAIKTLNAACCCDDCFKNATAYVNMVKKFKVPFAVALAVAAFLMLYPMLMRELNFVLLTLGWVLMGATMTAFPFMMAQTMEAVGIKQGMKTGRIVGLVILLSTPVLMFIM